MKCIDAIEGNVKLAKGGVAAGIQLLLQQYGIAAADIDEVYLAGAPGNYVNPISAMRISPIFPTSIRKKWSR